MTIQAIYNDDTTYDPSPQCTTEECYEAFYDNSTGKALDTGLSLVWVVIIGFILWSFVSDFISDRRG